MTFLWARKRPSGAIDYYLRRTERVDGKPKVVMNIYLGTAERILELVQGNLSKVEFELASFQFGTIASMAAVDRELGFSEIVGEVTRSESTARALLSFICARSEEPLSKNAMEVWSRRSAMRLLKALPSLSSRSYLRYMDRLTPDHVSAISFRIAKRLIEMGHDPSLVFFDTTNFSTEQDPRGDEDRRLLARAGHAKDHNSQAKLVGLATATTERHYLPIIHETFPGNENDASLFQRTIRSMVETLQRLGVRCSDVCFVFDKGMNSEDGFSLLTESRVHFVSSLRRNQAGDLISSAGLHRYARAYTTESGEEIRTFRASMTVAGVGGTVVIVYNASAEKRQLEDYQSAKKRFMEGCKEISRSLLSSAEVPRRGRPPTVEGVERRVISSLVPEKWRKVFRFRVGNTLDSAEGKITLTYWIDAKAEREKVKGFGKTAVFTDMSGWTDERIVRTYFARGGMEEDYRVLKDALLFPVMPIYHRLDARIRAHVFLCVMGLLFYRYIQWRLEKETGERVPMGRMVSLLHRIRLGGLMVKGQKRVRFKLEKVEKEEERVVKALALERFVPN